MQFKQTKWSRFQRTDGKDRLTSPHSFRTAAYAGLRQERRSENSIDWRDTQATANNRRGSVDNRQNANEGDRTALNYKLQSSQVGAADRERCNADGGYTHPMPGATACSAFLSLQWNIRECGRPKTTNYERIDAHLSRGSPVQSGIENKDELPTRKNTEKKRKHTGKPIVSTIPLLKKRGYKRIRCRANLITYREEWKNAIYRTIAQVYVQRRYDGTTRAPARSLHRKIPEMHQQTNHCRILDSKQITFKSSTACVITHTKLKSCLWGASMRTKSQLAARTPHNEVL